MKLIHALDERHELHVGFDRVAGMPPFGPDEEALLDPLARGLGP